MCCRHVTACAGMPVVLPAHPQRLKRGNSAAQSHALRPCINPDLAVLPNVYCPTCTARLNELYDLDASHTSEIRSSWYQLCINAGELGEQKGCQAGRYQATNRLGLARCEQL
jgi:hypothetical protein